MPVTPETPEQEKTRLEYKKLNLEISELNSTRKKTFKLITSLLTAISLLGVTYIGIYTGKELVDIKRERLEFNADILKRDLNVFSDISKHWKTLTMDFLDEPSGLTVFGVRKKSDPLMAIAVDDEVNGIFVLQSIGSNIGLRRILTIDEKIDDLEAVCYDESSRYYYAVASHRKFDKKKVMKMLRFNIDRNDIDVSGFKIKIDKKSSFENLSTGIYTVMRGLDLATKINNNPNSIKINHHKWSDKNTKNPYYALEIEGCVIFNNELLLGLKYPLDKKDKAILLRYNLEKEDSFEKTPDVFSLMLGDKQGITALAFDNSRKYLLVAANPTDKIDHEKNNGVKAYQVFAHSRIVIFKQENGIFRKVESHSISRENAKLEGMAVIDDELWLTFEGQATYIERFKLQDVYGDNKILREDKY